MIEGAFFHGWRRRWIKDGIQLTLAQSAAAGTVDVLTNMMPLLAGHELVDICVEQLRAHATDIEYLPGERGKTLEGEHFIELVLRGRERSGPGTIERRVGAIYGDRHMAVVDASFADAPYGDRFRDFARQLTREFPLCLGARVRFRRCVHDTPPNWAARNRGLLTRLFSPHSTATIEIKPAQPIGPNNWAQKVIYEDATLGFEPDAPPESKPHRTKLGMAGTLWAATGRVAGVADRLRITTALLLDDAFSYAIRLKGPVSSFPLEVADFMAVVDSLEPVPPAERAADGGLLISSGYWTD